MTQAIDIIKQIQEALHIKESERISISDECHTVIALADLRKAQNALKLIPSLLKEAERWEKGVSLEAIAKSLAEDTWFEADVLNCDRYVENHWKEHIQYAKAVLDKAEVKYYE